MRALVQLLLVAAVLAGGWKASTVLAAMRRSLPRCERKAGRTSMSRLWTVYLKRWLKASTSVAFAG